MRLGLRWMAVCVFFVALSIVWASTDPTRTALAIPAELLKTKAIVVGRLVKRVSSPGESFLVFENLRVVWGQKQPTLIVLPHPQECDPGWLLVPSILPYPAQPPITKNDIAQLKEGAKLLFFIKASHYEPGLNLSRWLSLNERNEESIIARELEPYGELDCIRANPFAFVDRAFDFERRRSQENSPTELQDLYLQGCLEAHFERHATRDQIRSLFESYGHANVNRPAELQLVWHALRRCVDANLQVPTQVAERVLEQLVMGHEFYDRYAMVEVVMQRMEKRAARQMDERILRYLTASDEKRRHIACLALTFRKVPAAEPLLRRYVGELLTRSNRTENEWAAVNAYVNLRGEGAAKFILERLLGQPKRKEQVALFRELLFRSVRQSCIKILRQLDDPTDEKFHSVIVELRVAAGDAHALGLLKRLVDERKWKFFPTAFHGNSGGNQSAWYKPALWLMAKRPANGNSFMTCVNILKAVRASELSSILVRFSEDKWFGRWAIQYLVTMAKPQFRPIFERFAGESDGESRFVGLAGLARLGDESAGKEIIRAMAFQDSRARSQAIHAALLLDPNRMVRLWSRQRSALGDPIEVAVDSYVKNLIKELFELKKSGRFAGCIY